MSDERIAPNALKNAIAQALCNKDHGEACRLPLCNCPSSMKAEYLFEADAAYSAVKDALASRDKEVASLREALKPFADEAEMFEDVPADVRLMAKNEDGEIEEIELTVGDLDRALSAYRGKM